MDEPTHRATRRDALIVDALAMIFEMLARAEDSAHTRELRAQARFYEHAVKQWTTVPPSNLQLDAMFELVIDLHGRATEVPRGRGATG